MFLEKIVATKEREVEQLKAHFSIQEMEKQIASLPACRGFEKALRVNSSEKIGLIAEVKKASPSKGLIRKDFDPVAIAKAYEDAKANCISVLTDSTYFQGSNTYLQQIRAEVKLPILRKDFTIDYRQIYEARLLGADAILLIVAILSDDQLQQFIHLSRDLGLDALIEVHDQKELERALALDASLIGINNRNLHTFETDIKTTEQLIKKVPNHKTIVSESGISTSFEINNLRSLGVDAVLVGEHFMRQPVVSEAVRNLIG